MSVLGTLNDWLRKPFETSVTHVCPECGPLLMLAKVAIVIGIIWVIGKYFTRNKVVLAIAALVAIYFLFL